MLSLYLLDAFDDVVDHKLEHRHEASRTWRTSRTQIHEEIGHIGDGHAHVCLGARVPHVLKGDSIAASDRSVLCAPGTMLTISKQQYILQRSGALTSRTRSHI